MDNKIKLYGFNNLTKSLSFNIYDVCYAKTERAQKDYIAYIDEQYNSERLTSILLHLAEMIGATVLSVSKQDYDPQGASVTLLIAEESMLPQSGDMIGAHLDKSHVTVHTYPEYHPGTSIATFRVDIDVATCGKIPPRSTLDSLIGTSTRHHHHGYLVRGFTRNIDGQKLFIDHRITSIQDYIDDEILKKYDTIDINMYQANIFHTKMLIKDMDLQNYLFNADVYELPPKPRLQISDSLRKEMIEIFSAMNVY
jgi:S-adenosylmethionine decarboxylase